MIDLQNMSYEELQELKKDIAALENKKTRTYQVSFQITFGATRTDDLSDSNAFADHIIDDIFSYWDLKLPERIFDVTVKEI